MKARNATVNIYMGGANIAASVEPYIKSVKYSDTVEEKSDTVEIVLADAEHQLIKNWLPMKGTEMTLELEKKNWNSLIFQQETPSLKLPLGIFELDAVCYRYPPSEVVLKYNSIPSSGGLRGIERNKSWEESSLRQIASDIASRAGLSLFYDAPDVEIKRAEQSSEPDLPFLTRLCKNAGLNLKIHDKKLVIFDALRYESKSPVITLNYGGEPPVIIKFEANAKTTDIYSGAEVNFKSNNVAEWLWSLFGGQDLFKGAFSSVGNAVGNVASGVLNINERVESEGEAERLARAKLRDKNKKEFTLNLTVMGSFSFIAGNVFRLAGHGIYNGEYICDTTNHNLGESGYTTQITAHRCLKGY